MPEIPTPEMHTTHYVCTERETIKAIHDAIVGDLEKPGLRSQVAALQESAQAQKEITGKLSQLIIGNGAVGLDERVRRIEAARKRDDDTQQRSGVRFWAICVLLMGNALAWVRVKFG